MIIAIGSRGNADWYNEGSYLERTGEPKKNLE